MTVKTFFTNFGHLADAPNGVRKLREFILQLAVQGKLVPQVAQGQWKTVQLGQVVEILDSLRKPVAEHDRKPGPYPYYGASGIVDYVSEYIFDEPLVLVGEDGAKRGCGENA
jgi:type I restriction enzyme S subunit